MTKVTRMLREAHGQKSAEKILGTRLLDCVPYGKSCELVFRWAQADVFTISDLSSMTPSEAFDAFSATPGQRKKFEGLLDRLGVEMKPD